MHTKTSGFTLLWARLIHHARNVVCSGAYLGTCLILLGLSLSLVSFQARAQAYAVPVTPAQIVPPSVELLGPKALAQPTVDPTQTTQNSNNSQLLAVEPETNPMVDEAARAEILKTFQREARAAYAEAQTACKDLEKDQQAVCLAKARVQYDQDMKYAQKRADLGY